MPTTSLSEVSGGRRARLSVLPVVASIQAYRLLIAPLLGPRCRFSPSCSAYAIEAFNRHGLWRGSLLSAARLLRCHPWGGSGHDPVPTA